MGFENNWNSTYPVGFVKPPIGQYLDVTPHHSKCQKYVSMYMCCSDIFEIYMTILIK